MSIKIKKLKLNTGRHLSATHQKSICLLLVISLIFAISSLSTVEAETTETPAYAQSAAGFAHSAQIDYDGSLYLWGDNTYGQSSAGTELYVDEPLIVDIPSKPIQVSLGAWHTMVLTENGDIYTCGRNTFGQLGSQSWENSNKLVKVEGLPPIVEIAAGSYHSLALAEDGSIWGWGNNTYGQLAGAESEDLVDNGQTVASRVSKPERIVDGGASSIAAGGHFSLYLNDDGEVYSWGDNSKGQLGIGTTENQDVPVLIDGIADTIRIEAGYEYAFALVQTEAGHKLYSWGDNSLGQLGINRTGGSGAIISRPAEVEFNLTGNLNITEISAGYAHVLAAVDEKITVEDPQTEEETVVPTGKQFLVVWGSNSFGQLGAGNIQLSEKPFILSEASYMPFDSLAAGGNHSIVMSSTGQMAAAGRGNQGQLGTVSIIDRSELTLIETKDHILPAWGSAETIKTEFNKDNELIVSWPQAQNNRAATYYRINIVTESGQILKLENNDRTSRTVKNLNPEEALSITIYAYDEASLDLSNEQLSLIYGSYIPESEKPVEWSQLFSNPASGTVQNKLVEYKWQPAPTGQNSMPAVPWQQSAKYNTAIRSEDDRQPVSTIKIVFMIVISLLIIVAANWLAYNFRHQRFLLYPLHKPSEEKISAVKNKLSTIQQKIANPTKQIIDMLKTKLKKKKD
ncbi:MAG: hypothetical protein PHQ55_01150 [Eubacteriales bacterium]|nr:hypothetical protein [Eubacteriales bacterium]